MDRNSTIVIIACLALIGFWSFVLVPKVWPSRPLPPGSTNAPSAAAAATNPAALGAAPPQVEAPAPAPGLAVNTNEPEQLVEVANADARYTFTSYGGGLKRVELLRTNRVATLNSYTRAPTLALLDGAAVQGDGVFKLTRTTNGNGVRAEKALTNGLRIVKDFELSSNYLVAATVRLENHSGGPLELPPQQWFVGTATPMGPGDSGTAVGVLWYNGAKTASVGLGYFSSRGFGCMPRTPPAEYAGGASNVVWVAAHNQYFTLAAMPREPAAGVVVRKVELPRPSGEEARLVATNAAAPEGCEAAMVYPGQRLGAEQSCERQVFLYAGPKEYQALARLGTQFGNNLDLVMEFGWYGFVSKPLLLGMNMLHHSLRLSYGWAVVAITVIIKLLFWPLTQASTRSMKRMQALQPQVKALQAKYKEEPVKMQRKMMELWKEHKVSPMSGCFPMLIQIPVFFGFYRMILSAIELSGARFLWVKDLAKPDTLFVIPGLGFVPFLSIPGVGLPFNLLPLIMGGTMLWQAQLTPPSPGMDPTQAKLMRYLPLIFMVGFYSLSSGLTLYWTVNNLLSIAQTKLTKTMQQTPSPAKGPVLTGAPKKKK
ncbi:MAG: membrane protein insertase YidC [Verrucomicrobiota bacterium]|jgi:YidC/Oxa1 family membrane protein insertase